jgi:hypothetical protein
MGWRLKKWGEGILVLLISISMAWESWEKSAVLRNNPPYRQSRTRRMAGGSGRRGATREKGGRKLKETSVGSEGHGQGRDWPAGTESKREWRGEYGWRQWQSSQEWDDGIAAETKRGGWGFASNQAA